MLMQTGSLQEILDEPNLTVVDVRPFGQYSQGHIPGAVNLDLFAFHWIDTSQTGLAEFTRQAQQLLTFCGAGRGTVVFYDGESGMLAARGYWLSIYLSHPDAHMLDGGMTKWQAEKRPVESRPRGFSPVQYTGTADQKVIAGFESVRDGLGNITILDARTPEEYDGRTLRTARPGHIPGAINVDWRLNLKDDGTLKSTEQLAELYPYSRDQPIITYCQGAYRAAHTFVALKSMGYTDVRVYLGSWGEWGNRPDLPVD